MSLPIEKLWRPDVFLYNAVESNFETGYPTNAIVQNNGLKKELEILKIYIIEGKFDGLHRAFSKAVAHWILNGKNNYIIIKINLKN
jgi:hypothetical protein